MSLVQTLITQLKDEVFIKKECDKVEVKILKTIGSDDHYCSDVIFAEASKRDANGNVQKLDLVIKYGIVNENYRDNLPIGSAFKTEIEIYTKVLPRFHKLQLEKSCPLFKSIPQCYFAKLANPTETIVLENLKAQGYLVHDKSVPLNLDHLYIVLQAYAEWHALSFALKDQYPQDYQQLTQNLKEPSFRGFFRTMFGQLLNHTQNFLYIMLEKKGEKELLQKYKSILGDSKPSIILENLLDEPEDTTVVLHGDCWNNNILFKYDEEQRKPTNVALIDFQMSVTRSPAIDISHFLYVVTTGTELQYLGDLLLFYHQKLSHYLQKLGSNPNKVFPLETFKAHWKKYSTYGAALSPGMALFCLVDDDLQLDLTNETKLLEVVPQLMEKKEYYERVLGVIKQFIEFDF